MLIISLNSVQRMQMDDNIDLDTRPRTQTSGKHQNLRLLTGPRDRKVRQRRLKMTMKTTIFHLV